MDMSEEEQRYVIEQIDTLIYLAKDTMLMQLEGTENEYAQSVARLEKHKRHILSMDGIEL